MKARPSVPHLAAVALLAELRSSGLALQARPGCEKRGLGKCLASRSLLPIMASWPT